MKSITYFSNPNHSASSSPQKLLQLLLLRSQTESWLCRHGVVLLQPFWTPLVLLWFCWPMRAHSGGTEGCQTQRARPEREEVGQGQEVNKCGTRGNHILMNQQ